MLVGVRYLGNFSTAASDDRFAGCRAAPSPSRAFPSERIFLYMQNGMHRAANRETCTNLGPEIGRWAEDSQSYSGPVSAFAQGTVRPIKCLEPSKEVPALVFGRKPATCRLFEMAIESYAGLVVWKIRRACGYPLDPYQDRLSGLELIFLEWLNGMLATSTLYRLQPFTLSQSRSYIRLLSSLTIDDERAG